ncbi:MAG: TetR/AcrR family transcriptional regulator [Parvularculaceae bacterium]|nr:TetR/AcrR family transcriptional regulator [Parvularculaceae bacterium]
MRRRVCEAATSHLAEFGYYRTSIGKIASRARVSQGALQHHYGTKEELIAAVAQHVLQRSLKWFSLARIELARNPDAFAEIVRRSWREQFCSEDYGALLEILTASRADEALRGRITPLLAEWRRMIDAELAELLPATDRDATDLDAILSISRAMMTGLLVHDQLLKDDSRIELVIEKWIELARR